ncbi:MAG: Ig-like domain-containing protein [Ruminococcus sp.]
MKKFLSILLAVLMATSVFSVLTVSTSALSEDDYYDEEEEVFEDGYYVVGEDYELFNRFWTPDPESKMTLGDDGLYHLVVNNVDAGNYEYKIVLVENGVEIWIPSGMGNNNAVIVEDDNATIDFTYKVGEKTGNATVDVEVGEKAEVYLDDDVQGNFGENGYFWFVFNPKETGIYELNCDNMNVGVIIYDDQYHTLSSATDYYEKLSFAFEAEGGSTYYLKFFAFSGISQSAGFKITQLKDKNSLFRYRVLGDGSCAITGYKLNAEEIFIPDTLDGRKVTAIDAYAMTGLGNLKKIRIPASVINIGNMAFPLYYTGETEGDLHLTGDFTMEGYDGTVAEQLAKEYNIKFVSLGSSTSINISKTKVYIAGTSKITVENPNGVTEYKVSDKTIAKVSSKGVVTGLKAGTTKITATNNGVTKTFKITVKKPTLNITKKTVSKGKTVRLTIKGKVGKATFTSSNKKVATVNGKGKVVAKDKGKATITALTNGKVKLNCKITVK